LVFSLWSLVITNLPGFIYFEFLFFVICLEFGFWDLEFVWNLDFGIWNLFGIWSASWRMGFGIFFIFDDVCLIIK